MGQARSSSLSAFWHRIGVATTRDSATRLDQLRKRLDRSEKRAERTNELIGQQAQGADALAARVAELEGAVRRLDQQAAAATSTAALLALARKHDLEALDEVRALVGDLHREGAAVARHVERAVASAVVHTDPFPYLVIEDLLPAAFYERLLETMPAREYWQSSGRSRDFWEIESDVGPWRTEAVWRFVDRELVDRTLRPLLVAAFAPHLRDYWRDAFDIEASAVGYRVAEGRLQRRRKGYLLRPHLDPPHAALTGLFYLARPGDDPRHGTGIYRPSRPLPLRRRGIYYPEDDGIALEHVATVPFKANSLLVWMTSLGAHGADLTGADVAKAIERFTYQFQVLTDDQTRRRLQRP